MIEKLSAPEWAPDNCPPAVVQLIDNEQSLEDLGLRGLTSADSTEFHQAMRALKGQLGAALETGKQAGVQQGIAMARSTRRMSGLAAGYLAVGFVVGALCGALVVGAALTY
jgi:hypothetical protein